MENKYTSLKLSKLLAENGCKLKTCNDFGRTQYYAWQGYVDVNPNDDKDMILEPFSRGENEEYYFAYDILNDICVKYAEQFFGWEPLTNEMMKEPFAEEAFIAIPKEILELLILGQKETAEERIWETCLFNPKNKK